MTTAPTRCNPASRSQWHQWLALCWLLMAIAVSLPILTTSTVNPDPIASYTFPADIQLPQWELTSSQPLSSDEDRQTSAMTGQLISAHHYRYTQGDRPLDIEMHYWANTNADIKSTVRSRLGNLNSVLQQQPGLGSYALYTVNGRATLNTCINPRGGSTVTSDGFKHNRLKYDVLSPRLLSWLMGQRRLGDRRCLATQLSTSIGHYPSTASAYAQLETAWQAWHHIWKHQFPSG